MHFLRSITISVSLAALFAAPLSAQTNRAWVILPAKAVKRELPLCSRNGPKIDGTWLPSDADIAALEKHLPELSSFSRKDSEWAKSDPEKAFRQYLGILVGKHRFIYINAIYKSNSQRDSKQFISICDGGAAFWGALYDPTTSTFSDLETNGSI